MPFRPVGTRALFLVAALASGLAPPAFAQIPDTFSNLQVLPQEIGQRDLINVMRNFAGSLGVRCNHCHVGENVATLEDFDFAAEDKKKKSVARAMMRMVDEINGTVQSATGNEAPVRVSCRTCHRGVAHPKSLRDEVLEAIDTADTADAAAGMARYRELRERYYGRASYDFGAGTLNSIGETLMRERQQFAAAAEVMRVNVEFNPQASYSHFLLGQALLRSGDRDGGLASLGRAAELEPENGFYKRALDQARTQEEDGGD